MIKNIKISRGYRLRQTTHELLKNIQLLTKSNSEDVISKSLFLYLKHLLENDKNKINNNTEGKLK